MSQYFFHCSIFLEHKYSACSVKPAACHLTQICPATICIPLCRFESILVVNAFSNLLPTTFQPFDGAHWWILIPRNKCVAITFAVLGTEPSLGQLPQGSFPKTSETQSLSQLSNPPSRPILSLLPSLSPPFHRCVCAVCLLFILLPPRLSVKV